MENFKNFLEANYIWFLIVTIVLVFALIGYLSEERKKKKAKENENNPQFKKEVLPKDSENEVKEQLGKMENVSLKEAIKDGNDSKKDKKTDKSKKVLELDEPLILEEISKEDNFKIEK